MFFTVPLNINEKFEWVHVNVIHINGRMMKEFFLCLITVGFIYLDYYFYILKKCGEENDY